MTEQPSGVIVRIKQDKPDIPHLETARHLPRLLCVPGGSQLGLATGGALVEDSKGRRRRWSEGLHLLTRTHGDRAAEEAELLLDGPSHSACRPPLAFRPQNGLRWPRGN